MQKLFFIFIVFFFFSLGAHAQKKTQSYHIAYGNINDFENKTITQLQAESSIEGQHYFIIQFYEHPTQEERAQLMIKGVELLSYIPNYAWIVSVKSNADWAVLATSNIRLVSVISPQNKLEKSLYHTAYYAHAIQGNQIRLNLIPYKNLSQAFVMAEVAATNFLSVRSVSEGIIEVSVDVNDLNKVAELPFVQFVEQIAPEVELELGQIEHRNTQRGNYLASETINGLHYDGTGVKIAVNEGGIIDTASHPEFEGRLNLALQTSTNISSHKTDISQLAAGAGNLDPIYRGMAFGAEIYPSNTGFNFNSPQNLGCVNVNNSYGSGCYTGTYNTGSQNTDNLIYSNNEFMISFSCGNKGNDSSCLVPNGIGWGNITGSYKQTKNVMAMGAVRMDDEKAGFSSMGPTPDGRIKPDVCAAGPAGTSEASPNVVGGWAQLYHAYKSIYSVNPKSALLKGVIMNTAEDLENRGPDFRTGFGRVNMRRAYELIANQNFISDSVQNNVTKTYPLNVLTGTKKLKVMVYWADPTATLGATKWLVNDIDLRVKDNANNVILPWVLNHTLDSASLSQPAIRGLDTLNNVEQVTIDFPAAGNYVIEIEGASITSGSQQYYVVFEQLENEVTVTYPLGGEHMQPSETQRIYWDSYGDTSSTTDISFSMNNGATWSNLATGLPASARFYDWVVPNVNTQQALIKVERGSVTDQSDEPFSIFSTPTNLQVVWSCPDSIGLTWDAVPNAISYTIFSLGAKYMDSIGTTTATSYSVSGLLPTANYYYAVSAVSQNNAESRRTIAVKKTPMNSNCVPAALSVSSVVFPENTSYPSCQTFGDFPILKLQNVGTDPLNNFTVHYAINNGTPVTENFIGSIPTLATVDYTFVTPMNITTPGAYSIKFWVTHPQDVDPSNDSAASELLIYTSNMAALPYTQNFDSFTNCTTAWGCTTNSCLVSQGWYNLINQANSGDDADWRTDNNGTASGSTGPSQDHTQGNSFGKYLYVEASNNGGPCTNTIADLRSPCFDLTNTIQPELGFWYHMYGSSMGSFRIDVLADNHWHNNLFSLSGDQGNSWQFAKVSLAQFAGKIITVRFRNTGGSNFTADMAIDDVGVWDSVTAIETVVSSADTVNIGPMETKYFISPSNKLLAKIENLSNHDFGSTVVNLTTPAGGTIDFSTNTLPEDKWMGKTIKITPTVNNINADVKITTYYTASELSDWETTTGRPAVDLLQYKSSVDIAQATFSNTLGGVMNNIDTTFWGNQVELSAVYNNGFSGVGAGNMSNGPSSTNNLTVQDIRVFPNPASKYITVRMPNAVQSEIKMYNQLGQSVQVGIDKSNQEQVQLQTGHLAEGVYQLNVNGFYFKVLILR